MKCGFCKERRFNKLCGFGWWEAIEFERRGNMQDICKVQRHSVSMSIQNYARLFYSMKTKKCACRMKKEVVMS
jgi:hypothetical protein